MNNKECNNQQQAFRTLCSSDAWCFAVFGLRQDKHKNKIE